MKFISFVFFTLIILSSCKQATKKETENFYQNPVIAGDFPDPSIIRVGETYYAAGTSCDFGPNYPIYESTDLINWKRIGSVFNEPPEWSSDDFWAPELFYKEGTFYVYYTTKRKDNRIACIGVATTKDIHKGFTDHGIIIEWGEEAIDAYVFQDEQKMYITWKAYGLTEGRDIEILASELSNDGLHLVGEHFTLTDFSKGWNGAGDEGQCIVKNGDYYYMFYSIGGCCDNRCDYRVMVSRSKNFKADSDWEQFPEPILQGGEEWLCTGHGTLVSTPDNRYFYLYHSYNARDFEYIGRQGMLDEVVWDKQSGWPVFKNGNTPSISATVPFKNTKQVKDSVFTDDFTTNKNLAFWEWDINFAKPNLQLSSGELAITPQNSGIAFLGMRPETGNYNLSTEMIPSEVPGGIGIYGNSENLLSLCISESELVIFQIKSGEKEILFNEQINLLGSAFLKYEAVNGRYFQFFWSENGEDWLPVESENGYQFDGTFIAQWGVAPRAGFIINGNPGNTFRYSELKVEYNFSKK